MQKRLADPTSPLRYIGFIRKQDGPGAGSSISDISKALRSQVWNFWDESTEAPPKTRPQEGDAPDSNAAPDLQVLAWQRGHPIWPEVLWDRFPDGSTEQASLKVKHGEFLSKFPSRPESAARAASVSVPLRVGGLCDFSVDGGLSPLDFTKQVSLPVVKEADFSVTRLHVNVQV